MVAAYTLTAMLTAAVIGAILSGLGSWLGVASAMPIFIPLISYLGLVDLGSLPGPRRSSMWQVPSRWVRPGWRASVVWGFFLGSGLSTQMPFPSYYALLLVVTLLPMPLGISVMTAYAVSRSTPAWVAALDDVCAGTAAIERLLRFRVMGHVTSGLGALFVAGAALGVVIA